jgi:hypothetical protein
MTLEFHDGTLQVSPGDAPRRPAAAPRRGGGGGDPATRQGDLF